MAEPKEKKIFHKNNEELQRLKLLKKEQKKMNNKPKVPTIVPKAFKRVFENVPDQVQLTTIVGSIRAMSFNVSVYRQHFFFFQYLY